MPWQVVNSIQLLAGNTIINLNGLFLYDGPPASGDLVISEAQAAGTDQFQNTYIKGVTVGKNSDTAQIALIPGSGGTAALIEFLLPSLTLNNIPNIAGGIVASTAEMVFSGPALAAVGQRDWVQMIMFSNDTIGDQARLELRYINDAQSPAVIMAMNGNTGVTFHSSVSIDAGNGPFVTGETYHTIGLPAGLTGSFRVRLEPNNVVRVDAKLSWTTTSATTFTLTGNLPSASYYPTAAILLDLANNGVPSALAAPARVFIPGSGAPQVIVPATSAGASTASCTITYATN